VAFTVDLLIVHRRRRVRTILSAGETAVSSPKTSPLVHAPSVLCGGNRQRRGPEAHRSHPRRRVPALAGRLDENRRGKVSRPRRPATPGRRREQASVA